MLLPKKLVLLGKCQALLAPCGQIEKLTFILAEFVDCNVLKHTHSVVVVLALLCPSDVFIGTDLNVINVCKDNQIVDRKQNVASWLHRINWIKQIGASKVQSFTHL